MALIDLEELNSDIDEFDKKYKNARLKTPEELNAYISDADAILGKYPDPEGEAREILGDFCSDCGCWVVVFGNDLEHGIPYYHKSIELCPDSYHIHWGYYTTLEEIVENDKYRTPELVQDAVDCLQFCIDYCNTPELRRENNVHLRYVELGRVYLAAGQPDKATECANKSLEIQENDSARKLLEKIEYNSREYTENAGKRQGFFARLFAWFKRR